MCTGDDAQIYAAHHRTQKSGGRIAAPVSTQGQLIATHAIGLRTVEVIGTGMTGLGCRIQPSFAIGMVIAQVRYAQFAAIAVVIIGTTFVALRAFEKGQNIVIAPALSAQCSPIVIVCALTAYIEQTVDSAGAAQHLAARPHHSPPHGVGLRLHWKLPGKTGVVDGSEITHRQTQPKPLGCATGFEQQDTASRVCTQAVGQHTTR